MNPALQPISSGELAGIAELDLGGRDISAIDLSGRELPNMKFSGVFGLEVVLERANLWRAQFNGVWLPGMHARGRPHGGGWTDMVLTEWNGATVPGSDFRYTMLGLSEWEGADASFCDFRYSDLREAKFGRVKSLRGADFRGCTYLNYVQWPHDRAVLESAIFSPGMRKRLGLPAGLELELDAPRPHNHFYPHALSGHGLV